MIIPKEKADQLEKAYKEIAEVEKQYRRGIITDGERKNKVQDIWTHTGEELANALFRTLEYNDGKKEMNPVFMMVDSGARGNRTPGQAAWPVCAVSWPSPRAKSSSVRSSRTSAKVFRCSSTSSPRTAPARVWPIPR